MAVIPPWLQVQPSDFVQAAAAGARLASSERENAARIAGNLQEAAMRTSAGAAQAAAERDLRRFEEQQQLEMQKQRQADLQDYRTSTLEDADERIAIAENRADIGASPLQVVNLGRGGVGRFNRATGQFETIQPSTPVAEQRYEIPLTKPSLVPGIPQQTIRLTPSELRSQFERLPEYGRTNAVTQLVRGMSGNLPAPAQSTGTVRVKSPNGKTGTIPASQLDEALKAKYTVIE